MNQLKGPKPVVVTATGTVKITLQPVTRKRPSQPAVTLYTIHILPIILYRILYIYLFTLVCCFCFSLSFKNPFQPLYCLYYKCFHCHCFFLFICTMLKQVEPLYIKALRLLLVFMQNLCTVLYSSKGHALIIDFLQSFCVTTNTAI